MAHKLPFLEVGDEVICLKEAGRDKDGLPLHVPTKGRTYKITAIYLAPYGVGCRLEGMEHEPYRGYFLHAFGQLYFKKVS